MRLINRPSAGRWAGLALLLGALLLYLLTLDTGLRPGELAGGDLITHQYAQVQGRPSNAPGYPLYTLGGWLWFHGLRALLGQAFNPIAILSAYSTLWALLALALLYRLILEATGNWLLSLLGGAFYAVTYFFWFYAVSTEQYASAVAHTLAIVLLAWRWDSAQSQGEKADRHLLALAFLCGLILAHLVTVAFVVPPLLWFVLSRRPNLLRRPRLMAQMAALGLLSLLSYAFVYVRGAQHPEWRGAGQWPSAWAWFWDFVSTQQGRDELTWSWQPLWTAEFPSLIWQELTWIVLLGGLAGLALLGRRRGGLLGGALLVYLAFCFVDRLGNWHQVIMPAYALLVVSFAATAQWVWLRLARRKPLQLALVAGLLLLIGLRFSWSLPRANQRQRPADTALLAGQAILADEPAHNAAVLGVYTETLSLRYLTDIWGQRPDARAVSSAEAALWLASGQQPLYVTSSAAAILRQEVSATAHLSSAGAKLILVREEPATTLPATARPLRRFLGAGLALAGYEIERADSSLLRVRLYWQADGPITHDWSISLRPALAGQALPAANGGIVQVDLSAPVHGTYPTSLWSPGEVVADDYLIPLAQSQPVDGLIVVVYRAVDDGFENLATLILPLSTLPTG